MPANLLVQERKVYVPRSRSFYVFIPTRRLCILASVFCFYYLSFSATCLFTLILFIAAYSSPPCLGAFGMKIDEAV